MLINSSNQGSYPDAKMAADESATRCPCLPLLPRAKQIIEEFPLSDEEGAGVFARNALKLLGK